jgi:hypothetical protein
MFGNNRKNRNDSGQTMVEFAMVLPIVLTIVFGVIEFGWLLWSYSSVNSAAREAARYGIAIGDGDVSGQRYYDCQGIREAGLKAGSFAGMEISDIFIEYDSGPNTTTEYATCEALAALAGSDDIEFGDRIVVSVVHDYQPLAAIMGFNIDPFTMIARANRTIVKKAEVVAAGEINTGGNQVACFSLLTGHTGDGTDPSVSPAKSAACDTLGEYLGGENVTLTASPDSGWSVGSWTNSDNDASTSTTNTLNMPGAPYTVLVNYINTTPICYSLTRSTTGLGSGTLTANPANSDGCGAGSYVSGEVITLTATPDVGSEIDGWSGTANDASTAGTNSVTMPASNHTVSVKFDLTSAVCYSLSVSHTGEGTDPTPSVANCAGGLYVENTVVTLNSTPSIGYEVGSWSGTDNDASTNTTNTITMTGDSAVVVNYVQAYVPDAPVNVEMPNNLALGEWHWNSGLDACQKVDLRWNPNPSWAPDAPIYYKVYKGGSYFTQINGWYMDSNFTIYGGDTLTLGVEAVFAGGVVSGRHSVTYLCREVEEDLFRVGSTIE